MFRISAWYKGKRVIVYQHPISGHPAHFSYSTTGGEYWGAGPALDAFIKSVKKHGYKKVFLEQDTVSTWDRDSAKLSESERRVKQTIRYYKQGWRVFRFGPKGHIVHLYKLDVRNRMAYGKGKGNRERSTAIENLYMYVPPVKA